MFSSLYARVIFVICLPFSSALMIGHDAGEYSNNPQLPNPSFGQMATLAPIHIQRSLPVAGA